ncbi:small integral membrane protein 24 isoform X2 [Falco peregrinus]|uniref:small integral membrane protein 24 isoform X2 n=1 Tax=Falco peregrinus TaxID=8954 RepID=UPI0024796B90|nr:small integral membrane protein 24 isoform X2 [Falco peregrinus]
MSLSPSMSLSPPVSPHRCRADMGPKELQPWLISLMAVVIFLFIVFVLLLINRLWKIRMHRKQGDLQETPGDDRYHGWVLRGWHQAAPGGGHMLAVLCMAQRCHVWLGRVLHGLVVLCVAQLWPGWCCAWLGRVLHGLVVLCVAQLWPGWCCVCLGRVLVVLCMDWPCPACPGGAVRSSAVPCAARSCPGHGGGCWYHPRGGGPGAPSQAAVPPRLPPAGWSAPAAPTRGPRRTATRRATARSSAGPRPSEAVAAPARPPPAAPSAGLSSAPSFAGGRGAGGRLPPGPGVDRPPAERSAVPHPRRWAGGVSRGGSPAGPQ